MSDIIDGLNNYFDNTPQEIIEEDLNKLEKFNYATCNISKIIINWQTGEPEEYGWYLVQIKDEGIRADIWSNFLKCWTTYTNKEVEAWYKTSYIEKYKQ